MPGGVTLLCRRFSRLFRPILLPHTVNMVEIELSAISRQWLNQMIYHQEKQPGLNEGYKKCLFAKFSF